MQGKDGPVPRWLTVVTLGLVGIFLLACVIPGLSRSEPTPVLTPTPQPLPSPTPAPLATTVVTRISEEEMSDWLQGGQSQLGEGVDFRPSGLRIRSDGITISGSVQVEQLQDLKMPVDILVKPVVQDRHLRVQVLDVRLGGGYSSFSSLVKPLVSAGIDEGLGVERYLAEQGVCVSGVELHEGYMIVSSVPGELGE